MEPALDEACESGDPGRRAALLLRRAVLRQQALLPGSADDLQTALRLAARPDRLRAEILGQISRALLFEDRHEEARQPAEQMLALATRLGDQECQNEAVITLAQIDVRQGHDSLSALQDARETARRIGSVWHELRAYGLVAHMLEGRGDHERAIQAGREGLARARQLGLGRFPTAPLVGYTAESLTSAGRWDEALQVISDGLSLDLAPRGRAFLLVLRGRIAVARGEQEAAARIVEQLHTLLRSRQANTPLAPPTAILTIEVRLAQGDLAGALAAVSTALAPLPDAEPRYLWPLLATGMRACAEALARLPPGPGDPAELQSALERAAAGIPRPGPVEQAHAAVFDAEASRAAGHPDRAAWDAAAAAWESLGQPYPLAYALLRAAAAATAAADRDAAASRLQRAAELAGRLRARPLLEHITRLARRAHVEITGTSPAGPAVPSGQPERHGFIWGKARAGKDACGPGPSRSSGSDAVASGWSGPGQLQSRAGAREQGQNAADGGFLAGGFGQREVRLDLVAVAAAVFLLRRAAGCDQVGDDAVSAAPGDTRAELRCRGAARPGRGRRAAATGRGWSGHSSPSP